MKIKQTLILAFIMLINFQLFSQKNAVILTKTDTIYCDKYEEIRYPKVKYWINEIEYVENNAIEFMSMDYSLTENIKDEFTGDLKQTSKFNKISLSTNDGGYSKPFVVYMRKVTTTKDTLYAIFLRTSKDLGCAGAKDNYIMIKFKNNEIIKLENDIANIDCSGSSVSIYVIEKDNKIKLMNNEIQSIRYKRSKYYEDFKILFPDYIMKTIELLDK